MNNHMQLQTVRHEIIETAKYLFLTKGFEQTSIQDIIEPLGVGESTLLGYFETLDELLEVIWSES